MRAVTTFRARVALALANAAQKIASPAVLKRALNGVDDSRGWWPLLRHIGFQQDGVEVRNDLVVAQSTVFACMSLIGADVGKLRAKLMQFANGIWEETSSSAFSPVLRKPNRFQTWQKFIEQWVFSLLSNGNTYVLKVRDNRGVVVGLYVLDPTRCRPLVSDAGLVYYQLQQDDLSGVFEHVPGVPASEIIHDRINCLFHPLVGVSPLFACGLTATKGLKIEENASRFFSNQSQPGGVLTAPGEISDETAKRLKEYFEQKFTGENAGKVAVLGDGLAYAPMTTNAVDAQLIEQLRWSAAQICATFHVPAYLVGAEPVPAANNVEALRLDYYSRCLQTIIEGIENSLDDGLGLGRMSDGKVLGIELDLDGLIRMDTSSLTAALKDQVGAGIRSPNEARQRLNLPPAVGGETPYLQQQNFSLAALQKRDQDDPFSKPEPAPAPPPAEPADDGEDGAAAEAAAEAAQAAEDAKGLAAAAHAAVQTLRDELAAAREAKAVEDAAAALTAAEAARALAEAARAGVEGQAADMQRFADSLRVMVADAVAKSVPQPKPDDDIDVDAMLAHFAALEPVDA